MIRAIAIWSVRFNVECPHCNRFCDVDDLLDNAFEIFKFCESESNLNIEVECRYCCKQFIIDSTEY